MNKIDDYKPGMIVYGRVSGIQPYGAFVSFGEDVSGLIHISELSNGFVRDVNKFVNINDYVMVKVIDVDKDDSFDKSVDELTDLYIKTIESCKPYKKIVAVIQTKSGKHIITHPFDASEFYLKIGELVKLGSNLIKKNDVTLLYENT